MPPALAPSSPRRRRTRCSRPTKAVNGGAGVLHIVKNYTGDIMNFEMAAELAQAEGIEVTQCRDRRRCRRARQPLHGRPARRGHHRAGREDLRRCAPSEGRNLAKRDRAVPEGQRLGPQHGHGADLLHRAARRASPPSTCPKTEMEIGIGIHGEPGRDAHAAEDGATRSRDAGRGRHQRPALQERATR